MDSVLAYQIYSALKIQIGRARLLADSGDKDAAREWSRFFRNTSLIELLLPFDGQHFMDVAHLEWQLRDLGSACHPSSGSVVAPDVSGLHVKLDRIAALLSSLACVNRRGETREERESQGGGCLALCAMVGKNLDRPAEGTTTTGNGHSRDDSGASRCGCGPVQIFQRAPNQKVLGGLRP